MSHPEQPNEYFGPPQHRPAPRRLNLWPLMILVVVIVALAVRMFDVDRRPINDPNAAPRAVTARGDLADDEQSTIELFRQAAPSVVFITTTQRVRRQPWGGFSRVEVRQGTGSGLIWDDHGHIVTNFHVISGATGARVTLSDQTNLKAQVVGIDPDNDLAVLRISASADDLAPIPLGRSNDLIVGQKVFAIGNPFGLDHTLTTGVISGLGRSIKAISGRVITDVVQTDAAINPGNSGGPLLDSAGRLIGVNTAIASPTGANAGVGFAVPVDTVNRIVPQIIRHGKVARPGLGIAVASDEIVRRMQRKRYLSRRGALVLDVTPNSAAARAGLVPTQLDAEGEWVLGDLIVAINDEQINDRNELFAALDRHEVGETITVTVLRNDQQVDVEATLQALES